MLKFIYAVKSDVSEYINIFFTSSFIILRSQMILTKQNSKPNKVPEKRKREKERKHL